jgi:hypothetical protein
VNAAYKATLSYSSRFDIISNVHKETGEISLPEVKKRGRFTADHPRGYNIVSGAAYSDHHYAAPGQRPRGPEAAPRPRKVAAQLVRDFDIISTNFKRDHVERELEERGRKREEAMERYARENRFDPLLGRYLDPREDEGDRAREERRANLRAWATQMGKPRSYLESETHAFDITSGAVVDPDAAERIVEKEKALAHARALGSRFEEFNRIRDFALQDARLQAAHNRIAPARDVDQGFDIITNEPYFGLGAKPKAPTRTVSKPQAHELIEYAAATANPVVQREVFEVVDDYPAAADVDVEAPLPISHRSSAASSRRESEAAIIRAPSKTPVPPLALPRKQNVFESARERAARPASASDYTNQEEDDGLSTPQTASRGFSATTVRTGGFSFK